MDTPTAESPSTSNTPGYSRLNVRRFPSDLLRDLHLYAVEDHSTLTQVVADVCRIGLATLKRLRQSPNT